MTSSRLPLVPVGVLAVLLGLPATAAGQAEKEASNSFERKYIDGSKYRADGGLLHDWPALTEVVIWSRRLQSAVAEEEQTISADLLSEFGGRIDDLRTAPRPAFLSDQADSIQVALTAIESLLARAEASLSAAPWPAVAPTGGAARADAENQRTIVTGNTAVTVPGGVAVGGQRDSLPAVTLEGGRTVNFVDLVALALGELDRLVHITRRAGAEAREAEVSPDQAGRGATPARETLPRRATP